MQSVFCICILYFAQSVFAIKYSLQNQFQSTISTQYCVDDDDDDSGGRTQRDCLSLTALDRRVSLKYGRVRQLSLSWFLRQGSPRDKLQRNRVFGTQFVIEEFVVETKIPGPISNRNRA